MPHSIAVTCWIISAKASVEQHVEMLLDALQHRPHGQDLGDEAEHGAAAPAPARTPARRSCPILWMKSAPSTPPSIPSMPAVKLNTRDAENITLYGDADQRVDAAPTRQVP